MKNAYEICGDVVVIHINSPKYGVLKTSIDFEDLAKVGAIHGSWYAMRFKRGSNSFYVRTDRVMVDGVLSSPYLHRLILDVGPDSIVDHIDMDGMNNRKINLRACSRAQNNQNLGVRRNNKSGYRGVSWCKKTGKWRAYVSLNGKQKIVGYFDTAEHAGSAVKSVRTELLPFSTG